MEVDLRWTTRRFPSSSRHSAEHSAKNSTRSPSVSPKVIRNATKDLLDNLDDDVPFLNPCLRPGLQQVHKIAKAFETLDMAAPAVPCTEATITEAFPDLQKLAKPVSLNAAGVKFPEHLISRHQNVAKHCLTSTDTFLHAQFLESTWYFRRFQDPKYEISRFPKKTLRIPKRP